MQGMRLANETAKIESMLKSAMTLLTELEPKGKAKKFLMKQVRDQLSCSVQLIWGINESAVRDVNEYFENRGEKL